MEINWLCSVSHKIGGTILQNSLIIFSRILSRIILNLVVFQGNSGVCNAGCLAITAVTLRTPENCKQVMQADGAQMIVQIIKTHIDNPIVMVMELFICAVKPKI